MEEEPGRVGLDDFSSVMSLVADDLFPLKPIERFADYVHSAIVQIRREVLVGHKAGKAPYEAIVDLSDHLGDWRLLGPYEARVAAHLLIGTQTLYAIPGGTGSGKTSTLRVLGRFVEEKAIGKGVELFIADLNLIPIISDEAGDPLELEKNEALAGLDRVFWAAYRDRSTPEDLVEDVLAAYDILRVPVDQGGLMGRLPLLSELLVLLGAKERLQDSPPDQAAQLVLTKLLELPKPGDRFAALVGLVEMRHRRRRDPGPHRAIIAIDNMDLLPPYLQQELLRFLVPLTLPISIMLVVPVRLATFETSLKAYQLLWFPHSGPLPADVVFERLTRFLLAPDSIRAYSYVKNRELQNAVIARCSELWLRLFAGPSEFRKIFEACVGNNIRNGFTLTRMWLKNPSLRITYSQSLQVNDLQQLVSRLLGMYIFYESSRTVAFAVADEVTRLEWHRTIGATEEATADSFGKKIAGRAACSWSSSYSRFMRGLARDKAGEAVAHEVRLNLKEHAEAVMKLWRDADHPYPVAQAVAYGRMRARDQGRDDGFCKVLHQRVLAHLPEELKSRCMTTPSDEDMFNWSCQTLTKLLDAGMDLNLKKMLRTTSNRWVIAEEPIPFLDAKGEQWLDQTSHYAASKALLDREEVGQGVQASGGRHASNVFAVDNRLCPAGLRVIYLLGEAGADGLTVGTLLYRLREHDYDENAIEGAINSLVEQGTRVIWIDKRDTYSYEQLESIPGVTAHLSASGLAYFRSLLFQPAYLQTMLSRIVDLRSSMTGSPPSALRGEEPGGILARLEYAHAALQSIVLDEYRRLEVLYLKLRRESGVLAQRELQCQSASGDVYVKSMWAFLRAIFSHYRHLRQDTQKGESRVEEMRIAKALAEKWLAFAKQIRADHEVIFGESNVEWEWHLGYAHGRMKDILG